MLLKGGTYPEQVVKFIKYFVNYAKSDERLRLIAEKSLLEPIPEKYIFDYVYNLIVYKPDADNEQNIRTVDNVYKYRVGNCVTYTQMLASLLSIAQIPYKIKIISYSGPTDFEHVYVITDKFVLDACIGQNQKGDTFTNRPKKGDFNKEVPYKYSKLFDMPELNLLNSSEPKVINNNVFVSRYQSRRYGYDFPVQDEAQMQGFLTDFLAEFDPFNPGSVASNITTAYDKYLLTPLASLVQTALSAAGSITQGAGKGVNEFLQNPENITCAAGLVATFVTGMPGGVGCVNPNTGVASEPGAGPDIGGQFMPMQQSAAMKYLPVVLGLGLIGYLMFSDDKKPKTK